jgi:hypothetical protein
MTVAAVQRIHLSESLQILIDSRLDTIERMLLGRVPRAERMAIVGEVESQIHELLGERDTGDLSREDVLAVLARLDPPEAYLPEDSPTDSPPMGRGPIRPAGRSVRHGNSRVARVSGILGLVALSLLLFVPVCYMLAMLSRSELPLLLCVLTCPIALGCGVLGIVLSAYARWDGAWALVGIVTSSLAVLFVLACAVLIFLQR